MYNIQPRATRSYQYKNENHLLQMRFDSCLVHRKHGPIFSNNIFIGSNINSLEKYFKALIFKQDKDKNIGIIKQEVRQYEKEIKERGAAIVNQERTKAEKEKTKAKKK